MKLFHLAVSVVVLFSASIVWSAGDSWIEVMTDEQFQEADTSRDGQLSTMEYDQWRVRLFDLSSKHSAYIFDFPDEVKDRQVSDSELSPEGSGRIPIGSFLRRDELQRHTINHGGMLRTYSVHYPGNRPPTGSRPLLIVLHGGDGARAETMASMTGFNAIADHEEFIVVYPEGLNGEWNDGRGKSFRWDVDNTEVDDVGYIASLIDRLVGNGQADRNRVYVTGVSNGGMMTHRLGIEIGDRLAAIAPVIANLPSNLGERPVSRPLPVLIMNGTLDPIIPWDGGQVSLFGRTFGEVLSTEESVRFWVEATGVPLFPVIEYPDDISETDNCSIVRESYRRDDGTDMVVLYTMVGGGHNYPGASTPSLSRLLGPKCMSIDGSRAIWSFLSQHELPQVTQDKNEPSDDYAGDGDVPRWWEFIWFRRMQ
jgi:polyhydroxybutyrate depolymerase